VSATIHPSTARRVKKALDDLELKAESRRPIPAAHTLAPMSAGVAIAVGAVLGLTLGILVSIATDLPLAPEAGLALGALGGWLSRRSRA